MHKKRAKFDVVVIGSGPGGEGAAMQATKSGLKTALVERQDRVGGNCTHFATIPSKTLRHVAHRITTFQNDSFFNTSVHSKANFTHILERSKHVISQQVARRAGHYTRNTVKVYHGEASLKNSTCVLVKGDGDHIEQLTTKNIVIATGSKPNHPLHIDFNHHNIFDSDSITKMNYSPKKIIIYGAGVVGCEYASIFNSLGAKVTLINRHNDLLNFLDHEIKNALSYHFRDKGIHIRHSEECEKVELKDKKVQVTLTSGKKIIANTLLATLGRRGDIENLGTAIVGIETTDKGHIIVNEHYQTSVPNIYAVGDLTGFPCLASSAYDQGRFAALHIIDPDCDNSLVKDVPVGIYTSPEISSIGQTEQQLTKNKIPYEAGHVAFKNLARAQITDQTVGMLKLLFHAESLEILGIHCFGQNAAEIVHIGQAIMAQPVPNNTLQYFVNTTFNYPTMAEAYRVAALNGMNRLSNKEN